VLLIAWQFRPALGREAEFVVAYGSDGAWASLFRKAEGYRGTTLAQDTSDPGRFLTLDSWDSEAAFEAFEREHAGDYSALDRQCEALCAQESLVGRFRVPPMTPGTAGTAR
jgi:heme-degrading monooxygenase HmoA